MAFKSKLKQKLYLKEYHQRPYVKERRRKYYKKYRQTEKYKAKVKEYNQRLDVMENRRLRDRKYINQPHTKEKRRKYRQENKVEIKKQKKEYLSRSETKIILKEYFQRPNINIKRRIKVRVLYSLKHYTETGKIMKATKYKINYKEIIEYLKPLPSNLQDYDIHHIKPLSTFNFINEGGSTNMEEVRKAFAPENHKLILRTEHNQLNHFELINGRN